MGGRDNKTKGTRGRYSYLSDSLKIIVRKAKSNRKQLVEYDERWNSRKNKSPGRKIKSLTTLHNELFVQKLVGIVSRQS